MIDLGSYCSHSKKHQLNFHPILVASLQLWHKNTCLLAYGFTLPLQCNGHLQTVLIPQKEWQ